MSIYAKKDSEVKKEIPDELKKAYAKGSAERYAAIKFNSLKILNLKSKASEKDIEHKKNVAEFKRKAAELKKERSELQKERAELKLAKKTSIEPYEKHNRLLKDKDTYFPTLSFIDQPIGMLRKPDFQYDTFKAVQIINATNAIVKLLGRVVWLEGVSTKTMKLKSDHTCEVPLKIMGTKTRSTTNHGEKTFPHIQAYEVDFVEKQDIWL